MVVVSLLRLGLKHNHVHQASTLLISHQRKGPINTFLSEHKRGGEIWRDSLTVVRWVNCDKEHSCTTGNSQKKLWQWWEKGVDSHPVDRGICHTHMFREQNSMTDTRAHRRADGVTKRECNHMVLGRERRG